MTSVFVRTVGERDLPAVEALMRRLWAVIDIGTEAARREGAAGHDAAGPDLRRRLSLPASEFLCADTGTALLGFAFGTCQGRTLTVHELAVAPEARRRNIATELLDELIRSFDDATLVQLAAEPGNEDATAFLTRWGFAARERGPTRIWERAIRGSDVH